MISTRSLEANNFLQSPPIEVRFAGFRSTTCDLQQAGWQLSLDKSQRMDRYAQEYRLAMKHEKARLYAVSSPMLLDLGQYAQSMFDGNPIQYFQSVGFEIMYMAPNIQYQIIPPPSVSFSPFDARPQASDINLKRMNLEDIAIFRPLNADSEIVVHPESVPKLMEQILEAQSKEQTAIRERRRKEEMRRNMEAQEYEPGYEPAKDIKCQLITLAG